jgi:sulfonate transport system substrate-binding protein
MTMPQRPSTNRRWPALLAALLVATFVLAGCGGGDDASTTKGAKNWTLRVGFIGTTPTPSGPEGWSQQSGALVKALKPLGIAKVTWSPFKNGPDLTAAMTGGSLDLGLLGDTPALTARGKGLKIRLVNQSVVGTDAWLVTKKGGPKTVKELAGTTVATQVGSYMYRYLLALLEQDGIAKKVKVTHIYTAGASAALASGAVAAYAAPAGQLTALLGKQGYPVIDKASVNHPELRGTSLTVIPDKVLAAHPGLPQAWNKARTAAVADITKQPDAYYAFAAKATQTPEAVVRAVTPLTLYPSEPFSPTGLILLEGTKKFLVDHKLAASDFSLTEWKVPSP